MSNLTAAWWARSSGFTSRVWARGVRIEHGSTAPRIVLFSDPDTLRMESTSEWGATRDAVRTFEERGVAVVLWGNETRSQMEVIQRNLDLHHPFVSETGAGLLVPNGYFDDQLAGWGRAAPNYRVVDFGRPYYQVAEALHEVARRVGVGVIAFSDMSIQEVAQHCGLSLSEARLAKMREYDEPFRMLDSEPATYSRICSALRRVGLRCFTHETLQHTSSVANKAQSLRLLASWYRQAADGPVLTVGLAKARSETCLLQAVDLAVVVQKQHCGRRSPGAKSTNRTIHECRRSTELVRRCSSTDQRAVQRSIGLIHFGSARDYCTRSTSRWQTNTIPDTAQ